MLTKEQGYAIADEVLTNRRQEDLDARNGSAPSVQYFYRSAESAALGRWQEAQLFRQANANVTTSKPYLAVIAIYLAFLLILWFYVAPHPTPLWVLLLFIFAIFVPEFGRRVVGVRRELRRLAIEHAEKT